MEPTTNTTVSMTTHKSNGALIGSIIIVLILILGGIYVFKMTKENQAKQEESKQLEVILEGDAVIQDLSTVSESDDLDSLDQDLSGTDFSNLAEEPELVQ